MNSLRYLPGDWYALVNGQHIVLLPASASAEQVNGLWAKLAGKSTVEALLSELLPMYQMNIAELPNFALIARGSAPHLILRGAPEFIARTAAGEEKVSGAGIATWAERKLGESKSWTLNTGSTEAAATFALPIGEGIVRVSHLEWAAGEDSDAAEKTPAVAKTPAPADAKPAAAPAKAPAPAVAKPAAASDAAKPAVAQAKTPAPAEAKPTAAKTPAPAAAKPAAAPAKDPVPAAAKPASAPSTAAPASDAAKPAAAPAKNPAPAVAKPAAAPAKDPAPAAAKPVSAPAKDASASDTAKPAAATSGAPAKEAADPKGPADVLARAADAAKAADEAKSAKASAKDAEDDGTFDSEATQDPAQYEQEVFSEELSLAGQLLGARGAAETVYDTGQGDDQDTIIKPRPAGPAIAAPLTEPVDDEHTIIRGSSIPKSRPSSGLDAKDGTENSVSLNEFILARSCSKRHANPPTASTCRECGERLTAQAQQVRKPAMGRMIVSDHGGTREYAHELNRSVVLGRQPSAAAVKSDTEPRLLKVDSPSGDISRSHLHVHVEGWHVQLVDLGATNGTVLLREGQRPRRLSRHQEIMLINGDVADLGDGVSIRFEDLP
ncbi:FHA domain-containing protein [Glutamicibacter sp. MCAF14]|uniref:FHA domain-containing protein n=1 Tax=Glutamicibacter sp. MCAF14 TaxID=3233043 RepID=UPI003F92A57D